MTRKEHVVLFFLVLAILEHANGNFRVDPLVDTKVGLIRGLKATDGDYSMFMGIPYAKVDKGNPFGLSTPFPIFDDVFEAYDDSAICPQIEEFNNTIVGTLDCLHLNVYVPSSAYSKNRLPVLVWIYGGSFSIGFAGRYLYGAKYLVRHDVILVTLNYRLGPYGFMCLDTPQVPGNQGLKDQLIALRWVKNNIESFGGDANNITLFGESAGSMSVDYHLISEQEKLFDKVILESGTSMLSRIIQKSDPTIPLKLAKQLGLVTNDLSEALSFITKADPHLVIAASSQLNVTSYPCAEKHFDGIEIMISDYTLNKNIPKVKGMHVLIGYNSEEFIEKYGNTPPEYLEALDLFRDRLEVGFDFDDEELVAMEELVRHFYIGDDKISEEEKLAVIAFVSDITYIYPTERSISKFIANGAEDVYYYVFSYVGGRNFARRQRNMTLEGTGAAHADEIGYLFDVSFWKETPMPEDQLIVDRMTTMWTNFAKYGNPTPETSELLPVKWEPITKNSLHNFLDIDTELRTGTRPFNHRIAFWDLFYKLNAKYELGYKGDQ